LKKNTLDCGSLRAREDTSNEEKLGSKEGSCVKGSRMRKPVPPPVAAEDLWLTEVCGPWASPVAGGSNVRNATKCVLINTIPIIITAVQNNFCLLTR